MSDANKAENTVDKLAGKAKEGLGKATDDESLKAEGRGQQSSADLKQAGEKVKDVFKN